MLQRKPRKPLGTYSPPVAAPAIVPEGSKSESDAPGPAGSLKVGPDGTLPVMRFDLSGRAVVETTPVGDALDRYFRDQFAPFLPSETNAPPTAIGANGPPSIPRAIEPTKKAN